MEAPLLFLPAMSPIPLDVIEIVKAPDTTAGGTDLTTEGGFSDICKEVYVWSTVRGLSTSCDAAPNGWFRTFRRCAFC
jgi:hypothetical protein